MNNPVDLTCTASEDILMTKSAPFTAIIRVDHRNVEVTAIRTTSARLDRVKVWAVRDAGTNDRPELNLTHARAKFRDGKPYEFLYSYFEKVRVQ